MSASGEIPVLVTTEFRGVFFGWLPADADKSQRTITLSRCRNVIYWAGSRGFLGMAASGPDAGSKLGSAAPSVLLHSVTSVSVCTEQAAKAMESWQ